MGKFEEQQNVRIALSVFETTETSPYKNFALKDYDLDNFIMLACLRFKHSLLLGVILTGSTLQKYLLMLLPDWTPGAIKAKYGNLYDLEVV